MDITLAPQVLGTIGGFPITNSLWVALSISILLICIFAFISRNLKKVPGTAQLFIEELLVFSKKFVNDTVAGNKASAWLFPIFTTLVLFFLFSNLIAYLPGLSTITYNEIPLYRTATADYGMIFAITFGLFILIQVVSIQSTGLWGYLKRFITFSSPLNFVLGILDIISELAKVVSLSFRLFGNVFAGEVLALVLLSLVPYVAPVPMAMLTLLSAVIQAFVFPILITVYFSMVFQAAEEVKIQVAN